MITIIMIIIMIITMPSDSKVRLTTLIESAWTVSCGWLQYQLRPSKLPNPQKGPVMNTAVKKLFCFHARSWI